jgi:curved DNA-binding protein CbpA
MGNTPSSEGMTKDEILEYQRKIISQQEEEIKKLNQSTTGQPPKKTQVNPYKILNIGKNYDETSLKKAYIEKAQVTHPDKGGNENEFKIVILCYKALLKKLKDDNNRHNHHDLRQHSETFIGSQMNDPLQNKEFIPEQKLTKNFNSNVFNKIYDENRIENVYDEGYGDWMKKNEASDESPEKMFHGEFNSDTFHNVFSEMKKKKVVNSNQIIKYDEPLTSISYKNKDSLMILGRDKIDDYSGESGGLAYRDYKDAFENPYLVDENTVQLEKRAKNINGIESERKKISYNMSPEDLEKLALQKQNEERDEQNRLRRLKDEETKAFDVYDRLHQRMIGPS